MANFAELAAELLNDIVQWCSHTDIKHLSERCSLLHNKMLPELYRNLDLSTHNATARCRFKDYSPWGGYNDVPSRFIAREWHPIDGNIARKQGLLIRTISENPHYGKYVRELHWTVLDNYHNMLHQERPLAARPRFHDSIFVRMSTSNPNLALVATGEITMNPYQKLDLMWKGFHDYDEEVELWDNAYKKCVDMERESFPPEHEPMWKTFHSFVHVVSIDFCWLRPWREATSPVQLFCTAKSVRLSGRMTHKLVIAILGDASTLCPRLDRLELSDLKLWAELEPAPKHHSKSSNLGRDSRVADNVEAELVPPAPESLQELSRYHDANRTRLQMRSNEQVTAETLSTIANYFSALTSLRITITGPSSWRRPDAWHELLYGSWARFLNSVRSTLCHLFFEQCEGRRTSSAPTRASGPWQTNTLSPMEWLFARHILPVLLDRPWPHVRRMEIRGAGLSERTPPLYASHDGGTRNGFPLAAEEQLRELLGCEAELIIEQSTQKVEDVDSMDPGIPPAYSQWEAWRAIVEQREPQHDDKTHETGHLASCRVGHREQFMVRGRHWTMNSHPKMEPNHWRYLNLVPHVKYVGPRARFETD